MRLLRDASLPVDDVLKNKEPRQFILPKESILPIPSPLTVASSDSPYVRIYPRNSQEMRREFS